MTMLFQVMRVISNTHMRSHRTQPIAPSRAVMDDLGRDALPLRVLVGAACPPPLCPSLALGIVVVLGPLIVVAGNSVTLVLRPELPYTSSVACGERTIVVPSTVMVPPVVNVCPPITNVVPVPGAAMYV